MKARQVGKRRVRKVDVEIECECEKDASRSHSVSGRARDKTFSKIRLSGKTDPNTAFSSTVLLPCLLSSIGID